MAQQKKRKVGRPKKKQVKKTTTIRVKREIAESINKLKGKDSIDVFLSKFLNSDLLFAVDGEVLAEGTSLAEARGKAILNAALGQRSPELPKLILLVGEDDGL